MLEIVMYFNIRMEKNVDRRIKRYQKKTGILRGIVVKHINNNIKEYFIVSILFVIGIILGVIFINNVSEIQQAEINEYISSFINSLKGDQTVDEFALLKESILKNTGIAILLWFMGSTVIGISIVYLIVCFRGFILGYTISSAISILGTTKGLIFISTSLLLQNLLIIPCILALAVSGMKLYNSIMKDKRKENIKLEILRHTLFSIFVLIILVISSLVEVYISKNLFMFFISYL